MQGFSLFVFLSAVVCGRLSRITTSNISALHAVWNQFSKMEETKALPDRTGEVNQGFLTSFAAFYRRWIVLEPTIFLFLVSGRMVYFTRTNLFIDVSFFLFVFVSMVYFTQANLFIDTGKCRLLFPGCLLWDEKYDRGSMREPDNREKKQVE